MKKWTRWMLAALLLVGLVSLSTGCGSSDDDSSDAAAADTGSTGGTGSAPAADPADSAVVEHVNIEGVWNGTRSSAGGSTSIQFSFNQSGGDIQGAYSDTSGYAGTLGGTINGDDIVFTLTLTAGSPGDTWAFSGAANATGTSLNGTMTTEAGTENIQATK